MVYVAQAVATGRGEDHRREDGSWTRITESGLGPQCANPVL